MYELRYGVTFITDDEGEEVLLDGSSNRVVWMGGRDGSTEGVRLRESRLASMEPVRRRLSRFEDSTEGALRRVPYCERGEGDGGSVDPSAELGRRSVANCVVELDGDVGEASKFVFRSVANGAGDGVLGVWAGEDVIELVLRRVPKGCVTVSVLGLGGGWP